MENQSLNDDNETKSTWTWIKTDSNDPRPNLLEPETTNEDVLNDTCNTIEKLKLVVSDNEDENVSPEGNFTQNTNVIRRSVRPSVMPKKLEDFVINTKVKYGVEKFVDYGCLNSENFCFV